jgi:hypothetical protein
MDVVPSGGCQLFRLVVCFLLVLLFAFLPPDQPSLHLIPLITLACLLAFSLKCLLSPMSDTSIGAKVGKQYNCETLHSGIVLFLL